MPILHIHSPDHNIMRPSGKPLNLVDLVWGFRDQDAQASILGPHYLADITPTTWGEDMREAASYMIETDASGESAKLTVLHAGSLVLTAAARDPAKDTTKYTAAQRVYHIPSEVETTVLAYSPRPDDDQYIGGMLLHGSQKLMELIQFELSAESREKNGPFN